jgi:hypothetical protein
MPGNCSVKAEQFKAMLNATAVLPVATATIAITRSFFIIHQSPEGPGDPLAGEARPSLPAS